MKVHLDRGRCQGHGRCYVLAPSVYEPDDDGYGFVVDAVGDRLPPELEEAARKGVNNCPEDAIIITDD